MAVVLFDGVCNLCAGIVRFVIARDPKAHFQFAALTSDAASRALQSARASRPLPDSLVVIDEGRIFTRSEAALRIARHLRYPWPLVYALVLVPRPIRDRAYDLIARHRYGWFGRQDACMVPSPANRARFLDEHDDPTFTKGTTYHGT